MCKFNTNIKRYVLVLILSSGLLSLSSCRYFERYGFFSNRSLKKALLWAEQDSTRVADSLKRTGIVKITGEEAKQDSLRKYTGKRLPVEAIKNKYHVIVGSFTNAENARLRAREYFNKGFKTSIIQATNLNVSRIGLVSVKSFENMADAKKYLTEFKRDVDSTAWIYSQN